MYIGVAVVAGLLIALVQGELVMRVARYGPDALLPWVMNSLHPVGTSGMLQASPIEELGFEMKPNLDRLFKKVPFRTNSAGMRDQEYALDKPPDTFRVAVIGDSYSIPSGVTIEDAYHSRVESSLNAAGQNDGSSRRYEFLNFSVGGYQLPKYLAMLRERALEYSPDLILIGFSTNDYFFVRMPEGFQRKPYREKPRTYPFFQSELAAWYRRQTAPKLKPRAPKQIVLKPHWRSEVEKYMGEFGRLSRETQIPIVVVFLAHDRWQYAKLVEEIEEIATANDLAFIDATEPFPEHPDRSLNIYPADGHANGTAHAMIADVLERELLDQRLVPAPNAH